MAATEPFMSAAPRAYNWPSRKAGTNGGDCQPSSGPGGTTSGVAEEQQAGLAAPVPGQEVAHLAEVLPRERVARALQPRRHQVLAARVSGVTEARGRARWSSRVRRSSDGF
jgi:hypothetical protein